jgi:hypothetical protein
MRGQDARAQHGHRDGSVRDGNFAGAVSRSLAAVLGFSDLEWLSVNLHRMHEYSYKLTLRRRLGLRRTFWMALVSASTSICP